MHDLARFLSLEVNLVRRALRVVERALGECGDERGDVVGGHDPLRPRDVFARARRTHLDGEETVVTHGNRPPARGLLGTTQGRGLPP